MRNAPEYSPRSERSFKAALKGLAVPGLVGAGSGVVGANIFHELFPQVHETITAVGLNFNIPGWIIGTLGFIATVGLSESITNRKNRVWPGPRR